MILWSQSILWHKKIKPVWLPWGSVFMSKPCETLKDWTHWGVMGVINPRHSAGDCQSESISLLSCEPCSTVYFPPVSWCTYRRKVIELNLTQQAWHSLGKKRSSVSQREVNWDSLQFSSICAVDCAAAESTSFRIPSIERSCNRRYNTDSDSAAGNPPCVSRPVCQGQESRKSEREGWRAACGTQSCQQPLTYTWHPRDGLSIDLSSPSHLISLTSARSFSLLLSAPLFTANWLSAAFQNVRPPHDICVGFSVNASLISQHTLITVTTTFAEFWCN